MKLQIINSWEDLTLQQFVDLAGLQSKYKDQDLSKKVIEYLYGVDPEKIPIVEYMAYVNGLNEFIAENIPEAKLSPNATYSINGTTYRLDLNPASFSTAQYIDFVNYSKENRTIDILSVVLIPDGHTYNDGYDLEKAKADIAALPVTSAIGIVNFFVAWSKRSIKTSLRFLTFRIRRTKGVSRTTKKDLRRRLEDLYKVLGSFPSY